MPGEAVLDTNAVVQMLNGRLDPLQLGFEEIIIPMTAVGELFLGYINRRDFLKTAASFLHSSTLFSF
jgi:hypothetical protein